MTGGITEAVAAQPEIIRGALPSARFLVDTIHLKIAG